MIELSLEIKTVNAEGITTGIVKLNEQEVLQLKEKLDGIAQVCIEETHEESELDFLKNILFGGCNGN